MKYRKRPVVVEAYQWDGSYDEIVKPMMVENVYCEVCGEHASRHGWIKTLEGGHRVCPPAFPRHAGDWVIEGVAGEHYPIKPAVFAETYEAVEG